MDINKASLDMHYELGGKIEVISRKKIETREDLSLAYTPGVAEPCRVISKDYEQSFKLTRRSNLVCLLWKENAPCLKSLQALTLFLYVLIPKIQIPSSRPFI